MLGASLRAFPERVIWWRRSALNVSGITQYVDSGWIKGPKQRILKCEHSCSLLPNFHNVSLSLWHPFPQAKINLYTLKFLECFATTMENLISTEYDEKRKNKFSPKSNCGKITQEFTKSNLFPLHSQKLVWDLSVWKNNVLIEKFYLCIFYTRVWLSSRTLSQIFLDS